MADWGKGGKGSRRGGGKGSKGGKPESQDYGYGDPGKGYGGKSSTASKDVVHHYPPKEMAADVGYPIRGGQTLLIAYFPWEASEADIEREFAKFCRVKRVHLVVDKSSRKPRCFGFVKFLSKSDAEEALQATCQGLVQLPDTRGHVWHLKAEWTKSGDMVVDDSEAEQEVAKRKEERRSRSDVPGAMDYSRGGGGGTGKGASSPPKGALHPGVPAPLPPLQTRYPQAALGMPPPPPSGMGQPMAGHGVPPLQHPLPPQGQLYGGQHMYGSQSQLYGQQAYSGALSGASPVGPALGRDSSGVSSGLDAPGLPGSVGAYPPPASGAPPPLLRDLQGYASAYPGSGYAAAVAAAAAQQASGYPPAQSQSYVGAQGYGASQAPYVSSQQAYASSAYSGQQAAYAAGQQAYQTAAATASGAGQPPGYGSQLQGYPPQGAAAYGAPPGYGAYTQQASSYPANPATAYATSNFGLNQQSAYNYPQQQPAAGVMAYGSYPGGPQPGQQATVPQHQGIPAQALAGADPSRPQDSMVAMAQMPPHQVPQQAQQPYGVVQSQPMPSADTAVATGTLAGQGGATAPGHEQSQQQYLDMVWQLDIDKASLPAPPAQQPPAPPAGHVSSGLAVPAGVSEKWEGAGRPGGGAAVWNSFDDAAAKGMVDGLVGGDDAAAAPPPLPPPPPAAGGSNAVWGSH